MDEVGGARWWWRNAALEAGKPRRSVPISRVQKARSGGGAGEFPQSRISEWRSPSSPHLLVAPVLAKFSRASSVGGPAGHGGWHLLCTARGQPEAGPTSSSAPRLVAQRDPVPGGGASGPVGEEFSRCSGSAFPGLRARWRRRCLWRLCLQSKTRRSATRCGAVRLRRHAQDAGVSGVPRGPPGSRRRSILASKSRRIYRACSPQLRPETAGLPPSAPSSWSRPTRRLQSRRARRRCACCGGTRRARTCENMPPPVQEFVETRRAPGPSLDLGRPPRRGRSAGSTEGAPFGLLGRARPMTAQHLEILVEEPSDGDLPLVLLYCVSPEDCSFRIHVLPGRRPSRQVGAPVEGYARWMTDETRLIVVVDRDRATAGSSRRAGKDRR